ncbi:MAG: LacI family DNA-binding transcriptional regulator [Clostridia bacterium]|nr:LacI family DNA-binding transcriptional regulator [Clostridia bacterium]
MAVTIKQIAEICGVSRGTVDRVLHGRGRVNPETEKLIKKTAEEMGYSPNTLAKALSAKNNPLNFYVVIPSWGNPYFDDMYAVISKAQLELEDFGINITVKTTRGMELENQIKILDEAKTDASGIIIMPAKSEEIKEKINELCEKNIPVITLNTDIADSKRLCFVGADYISGGETACGITGLLKGGKANVGVITDYIESEAHSGRISGFEKISGEKYQNITIVDVKECGNEDTKAYYVTKELLMNHPETDTLLIDAGGIYGCIRAVRDYEEKIDVICFDVPRKNAELFKSGDIKAAVCQNPSGQAYIAINILFNYVVRSIKPENECIFMNNEIKIAENF